MYEHHFSHEAIFFEQRYKVVPNKPRRSRCWYGYPLVRGGTARFFAILRTSSQCFAEAYPVYLACVTACIVTNSKDIGLARLTQLPSLPFSRIIWGGTDALSPSKLVKDMQYLIKAVPKLRTLTIGVGSRAAIYKSVFGVTKCQDLIDSAELRQDTLGNVQAIKSVRDCFKAFIDSVPKNNKLQLFFRITVHCYGYVYMNPTDTSTFWRVSHHLYHRQADANPTQEFLFRDENAIFDVQARVLKVNIGGSVFEIPQRSE